MNKIIKTTIKSIIPLSVRNCIRNFKALLWKNEQILLGYLFQKNIFSNCESNTIFLIGIPEHGNLGDQAIGYAEKEFLSKIVSNRKVFYITEYGFYNKYLHLKKFLRKNPNSEILWHGGGNIGDIYKFHETMRLFAVEKLPNVKFTIMPQSIDYNDDSKKLCYAKKIYNSHLKLTFCTREKESYEKAKRYFPKCKVYLVPDIVMTYKPNIKIINRQNVLLCTRNDIEVNTESKSNIKRIIKILEKDDIPYKVTDTVDEENYSCEFKKQGEGLYNKWKQFASSKVVITDRLHGMIFSLITNTPCIALDNSTGKVSSFYHTWLEGSKILLIEKEYDIEKVSDFIKNSSGEVTNLDDLHLKSAYDELISVIQRNCDILK